MIFLLRGFGITAGCHAAYDILIVLFCGLISRLVMNYFLFLTHLTPIMPSLHESARAVAELRRRVAGLVMDVPAVLSS